MSVDTGVGIDAFVGRAVLPGDVLGVITADFALRLGAGLTQKKDRIVATRAGVLRRKDDDKFWIESVQRRYVAAEGDLVVGVVTGRSAESFDVDIGGAFEAVLPFEHFEGATKRNKPTLEVGDLVYCRVTLANRDMQPELSCVNARGKAAEFGHLKGGFHFRCSANLSRSFLHPQNVVLRALGRAVPFEIAAGMNGRVWVSAGDPVTVCKVAAALQNSEHLSDADAAAMCAQMFPTPSTK